MTRSRLHPFRLLSRLEVRVPLLRPLTRRVFARRFDALAPVWDRIRDRHPDSTALLDASLAEIGPSASGRLHVLDLGTGTGQAAFLLRERLPLAEIDAVDASPAMIEQARRKLRDERIRFAVADGADLPFADASFDLVVCLCVQPFYGELARVVRPGGWVVFAYALGPETPIYFRPAELERGLRRVGFAEVRTGAAGRGEWTAARRGA